MTVFDNFKFTSIEDFKFMNSRPETAGQLENCASNQMFMRVLRGHENTNTSAVSRARSRMLKQLGVNSHS